MRKVKFHSSAPSLSYKDLRGSTKTGLDPNGGSTVTASTFFDQLRNKTRISTFDLPTEAQWGYAAREEGAATGSTYYNNASTLASVAKMDPYVVYATPDASNRRVLPVNVGAKLPNKLGLYDMIGGVWEWTLDRVKGPNEDYEGESAAVQDPLDSRGSKAAHRGCGFEQNAAEQEARGYFRSALRGGDSDVTRHNSSIGFRVAATLPTDAPDFVVDSGTPKAFAKLSVLPTKCDGWYTISGIRPENLAAGTYVVQTNTYPWYSGKNWMTNVYNTVMTDWKNCGGIISNAGALGAPYTNQLVVTIFPKEGGET